VVLRVVGGLSVVRWCSGAVVPMAQEVRVVPVVRVLRCCAQG
jgi:hypothetical protein